jgi:transposase
VEGVSIVDVATRFGVSRPTVYQAKAAFQQAGLSGLLPKHRGQRRAQAIRGDHRACAELANFDPGLTTIACIQAVQESSALRFTAAV